MTKRTNFNKWPENMFDCLKKHLPRPLVETGPCNHLASFGKPEKAKTILATKTIGLNNILMAKVCSELAREQCQSSLGACSLVRSLFRVRPELVRSSFGVCSEFVRSLSVVRSEFVRSSFEVCSFGACSELVHGKPGASEKRLLRKHVLLRIM